MKVLCLALLIELNENGTDIGNMTEDELDLI
jgi:hypothetical protein